MDIILKASIAVILSVLMLLYIKSFIKQTRPNKEIWITFGFSMLSTALMLIAVFIIALLLAKYSILETLLFSNISNPLMYGILYSLFTTAVPEEGFKLIIISQFCMRRRYFKKLMDGIVFGAAVSIGFATIENIWSAIDGSILGIFGILGVIKILLLQAMLGGIMGYHLSKSRSCKRSRYKQVILAFTIPCGLHALHNFPGSFLDSIVDSGYNLFIPIYFLLLAVSLSSLVIAFCILKKYLYIAREELNDEIYENAMEGSINSNLGHDRFM